MSEPTVPQAFAATLDGLVKQVQKDRSILAAILCGSLAHDTVWDKSDVDLVLITIDEAKVSAESISLYADGVKFLERVPRLDAEALAPIVEFMGKKPMPVETIADNSIVNRLERDGFIVKLYSKR